MARIVITVDTHTPRDGETVGVRVEGDHPDINFDMSQLEVTKYILQAVVISTIINNPSLSNYVKSTSVVVQE